MLLVLKAADIFHVITYNHEVMFEGAQCPLYISLLVPTYCKVD